MNTLLYVGIVNRSREVAEALTIYNPAWPDIEKYVEGVFWDESERGPIPEPETPEGYNAKRMIKLEGEGASLIYYTYEPLPEPEETQVQRLQKKVDMLTAQTSALADTQEMHEGAITEIALHVYE